ncbi:MAG: PIN domain-containing protein [Anaerolineae bacterium]|nr:PIN domain-containing protein [Anaerolineae bacterium]
MTGYVLDTNILSLILRRNANLDARLKAIIRPENIIWGCPIVWYELRRGLLANDAKMQMRLFEELFATFNWDDFTRADWSLAANWWMKRRNAGLPVSDADLMIAVFAYNRDAVLVTNNAKDFQLLDVHLENWATD